MKIPNGNRAIIDDAKVRDYLLSPDHPIGRFKARVFASVGYHRDNWQRLRDDLLALASTIDAKPIQTNAFGERWAGTGQLRGPNGTPLPVVTVWLIPSEGASPRLITAYPASAA
jgi:hypothetical protein